MRVKESWYHPDKREFTLEGEDRVCFHEDTIHCTDEELMKLSHEGHQKNQLIEELKQSYPYQNALRNVKKLNYFPMPVELEPLPHEHGEWDTEVMLFYPH